VGKKKKVIGHDGLKKLKMQGYKGVFTIPAHKSTIIFMPNPAVGKLFQNPILTRENCRTFGVFANNSTGTLLQHLPAIGTLLFQDAISLIIPPSLRDRGCGTGWLRQDAQF
jgi:hypothetical protein